METKPIIIENEDNLEDKEIFTEVSERERRKKLEGKIHQLREEMKTYECEIIKTRTELHDWMMDSFKLTEELEKKEKMINDKNLKIKELTEMLETEKQMKETLTGIVNLKSSLVAENNGKLRPKTEKHEIYDRGKDNPISILENKNELGKHSNVQVVEETERDEVLNQFERNPEEKEEKFRFTDQQIRHERHLQSIFQQEQMPFKFIDQHWEDRLEG
ncbi:ribonuclease Y-like [Palaemon carinicauda]|uniref:ribonuclease Y-like n=1 Tax=Palaemon carinicauda TaxID=392227 RepID=UPI0035B69104